MERRGHHRLHSCIARDSHGLLLGHPLVDSIVAVTATFLGTAAAFSASRALQALSARVSDSLGVGRHYESRPRSGQVCCGVMQHRV